MCLSGFLNQSHIQNNKTEPPNGSNKKKKAPNALEIIHFIRKLLTKAARA